MSYPLRIGTRKSQLALWQTYFIRDEIQRSQPNISIEIIHFTTKGDQVLDKPLPEIGGKGLFTLELEQALLTGEIDLAVHSLKDLPTQMAATFTVGAILPRANPFDALVNRAGLNLADLPQGAIIGTSSLRRAAQLKAYRPDLQIQSIRGNVETRLKKILDPEGGYTAGVLAVAGLERLGLFNAQMHPLPPALMLPAPAQGAIAVQCRAGDAATLTLLHPLDDAATRACITAERAFLAYLEAGCSLPVSAYATLETDRLHLTGRVNSLDGQQTITVRGDLPPSESYQLGVQVAKQALAQGAEALLKGLKS